MRIEEYGFKGTLIYRKATFAGAGKHRKWVSSSVGHINLYSSKQIRDFLRKNDLADLVQLKVEFGCHGFASFTVCYNNTYLIRLREVASGKDQLPPLRNNGITKATVRSQIDSGIKASSEYVKKLQDSLNRTSVWARSPRRIRGLSYNGIYDEFSTYTYNHSVDFYAIPSALKVKKEKFKKQGPKPDPMALYYKRHKSWG